MSPRTFVLRPTLRPLAGRCPSCGTPFDVLGCRVVDRARPARAVRQQSGIAEVIQVECHGISTLREITCPCCAQHPDTPHPAGAR